MKWDVEIGNLSFLYATNQQSPYRRETADFRRQRIDQEREVGEQSLDSGYWLRSQSSFHYGAGLESAEPLEVDSAEARFRFRDCMGLDVWTPGQLSLLRDVEQGVVEATYTDNHGLLGLDRGVMHWSDSAISYSIRDNISVSGGFFTKTILLSTSTVSRTNPSTATDTSITSATNTGDVVAVATAEDISIGSIPNDTLAVAYNGGTAINLVRWVKQRLIVADGGALHEITDLSPATPPASIPAAHYTHPDSDWQWTDAADGPAGIYVSGSAGATSAIYLLTVAESSGVVTMGQPIVVAELPRGETVTSLYSYVGTYLVVGTSKGVRVAAMASDGSISLGPLLVESDEFGELFGGVHDAVGVGRFVYVTVGGRKSDLYRIDLGQALDGDLRFAYAPDLNFDTEATEPYSYVVDGVTVVGERIFYSVRDRGLFVSGDARVDSAWLESGRIRLGTLQPKAWLTVTATRQPETYTTEQVSVATAAADGAAFTSAVAFTSADGSITSKEGAIADTGVSPDLYVRINFSNSGGTQSPTFTGYQIAAIPAPKRSRLVQLPLSCWDWEVDRNGVRSGGPGYSWERLSALEDLESSQARVTFTDTTTGESSTAYIERVTFTRLTPPVRGNQNAGGIAQVLLRLID